MYLIQRDNFDLNSKLNHALQARLTGQQDLTHEEIEVIKVRETRIFPKDYELSLEQTESFRVLCKFSKFDLTPRHISSHRKYVGPLIVSGKRVFYRLIALLLRDVLAGQEVFNKETVKALARMEKVSSQSS